MQQPEAPDVIVPLSPHAQDTLAALGRLAAGSVMRVSPLCHEMPTFQREVRGWVLDVPQDAPASALPIGSSMFDGVTVVRCHCSENTILDLLRQEKETRAKLGAAVRKIMRRAHDEPCLRASWPRCRPTKPDGCPDSLLTAVGSRDRTVSFHLDPSTEPVIDREHWVTELSPNGFVGLYHHWHEGHRRRRLCLYVVCQSYLPKPCIEFIDLVQQSNGTGLTALDVCNSEDAQWLRSACARNRARIIAEVCEAVGLPFPSVRDYHAPRSAGPRGRPRQAIPTSETLHHDIVHQPASRTVRLLNYCAETSRSVGGIICTMAPWDAVWIFHGARSGGGELVASSQHLDVGPSFGAPYGTSYLPTCTARVSREVADSRRMCMQLSFTTCTDQALCRPLMVWPRAANDAAAGHINDNSNNVPGADDNDEEPAILSCPQQELDEMDDRDVAEAYARCLKRRAMNANAAHRRRVAPPPASHPAHGTSYLMFDEAVMQVMANKGWCRAHGFTALIPLACAFAEHAPPVDAEDGDGDGAACGDDRV